ncbi:MAG: hypothetical protein ACPHVL_07275, partial [Psychroflexus salarius]
GRIKRRFDKWRIKLPRAEGSNGRFRATHFLLTLYFDNTYNKELGTILPDYLEPSLFNPFLYKMDIYNDQTVFYYYSKSKQLIKIYPSKQ